MTDVVSTYLEKLKQNRLPGIDLSSPGQRDGFIYPAYQGQSILNIPASLCRLFGIPEFGNQPLDETILSQLGTGYRRVILILMDALALHRLQRWTSDGAAPIWKDLAAQGLLAPLTSITPSTTSAALTALWTGRSATEHGITGYEMWMKEYGVVANTILHSPITFKSGLGSLSLAGFDPKTFLPHPTLGPHFQQHGVKVYALQHRSIVNSGLSTMLFKDIDVQAYHTAADLWINLRELIENKAQEQMYIWLYWSEVDHFSHLYGPDDERTRAEFSTFSQAMEQFFLGRLSPALREDTLLILTADHGQINTHRTPHYELRNHPEFMKMLHIAPTGENRLAFLYLRPGQIDRVRAYIEDTWPGQFSLLDTATAIKCGLFGPGTPHQDLADRAGDYVLAARDNAYLWWANKDNPLVGRHGGLHPDEMLVPFLAARL